MNNLELSIERELDFLIKHQLTPDELYLMKLIWYAQEGHDEYLSQFFSQNQLTKPLRQVLLDLQNKGVINKTYIIPDTGTVFNPNDVDFNKNLIKSFLQHSQTLGMELFEAYPPTTTINGKVFSLRNITKLFKSLDDMCWAYGKAIKFDVNTHNKVLELLEYGKDNNLINSGLCDFIVSHKWDEIQLLKDTDQGTFKTVSLI